MKEHLPENYLNSIQKSKPGRNDLGHNPEVLFQTFAFERSIIRTLYKIDDFSSMKVLDIGCGDGGSLINLIKIGFDPANLAGIDILDDRIKSAKRKFPNIGFITGDAACLPFSDCQYDLVMESTMFIQLTDDELCRSIALEMIRVTKKDGHIMLIDWRYSKPGNSKYDGLSKKRLKRLFEIDSSTELISVKNGALVPFIGRFISQRLPFLYFLIQALFPFMSGQVTYLLKKRDKN